MGLTSPSFPLRVLIVSTNPLFQDGLRQHFMPRWAGRAEIVAIASTLAEMLQAIEAHRPQLLIVDDDDQELRREEVLRHFASQDWPLQVVFVSLARGDRVLVYQRHTMTSLDAEEWLAHPWETFVSGGTRSSRVDSLLRREDMRHFVIVSVLVLLFAALTYLGLQAMGLMPVAAAIQAAPIDWLFNLEMAVISFLFALIVVPLVYSLFVFRRRPGDTEDGVHIEGNTRLEVTWTVIPLFVVLLFAYLGAVTLGETRRVDPNAMVVNVTGFQWAWRFEYPEYGITTNQLYLPANRQVVLKLQSPDVIHSFWVPEFRVKQDVVPGRVTEYRITPSLIGEYKVRCAELCGVSHAYMEAPVVVVSEADFQAWVQQQQAAVQAATGPDPARGEKLYNELGCKACHSLDGSDGVGPTWKGLWGETVHLADGTTLVADEAYITESIREPNAKVVAGFPAGAMPPFNLSDAQIADLIAFIKTLK